MKKSEKFWMYFLGWGLAILQILALFVCVFYRELNL